jgi:type II secretory pathway component HofQ
MQQEGMMQEQVPEEEIKARIQSSTDQIKEANKQLWQSVTSILTPQQLEELDKMRHGQLIITTSAASQNSTDKNKRTIFGVMTSDKPEPALKSSDKENLKRILSNQAKHDITTDFSGL